MREYANLRVAALLLAVCAALTVMAHADVGEPADTRVSSDRGFQVFG